MPNVMLLSSNENLWPFLTLRAPITSIKTYYTFYRASQQQNSAYKNTQCYNETNCHNVQDIGKIFELRKTMTSIYVAGRI